MALMVVCMELDRFRMALMVNKMVFNSDLEQFASDYLRDQNAALMAEVKQLREQMSNGGSTSNVSWSKVVDEKDGAPESPRWATPPPRHEKTTRGGTQVSPGTPPGGIPPAPPRHSSFSKRTTKAMSRFFPLVSASEHLRTWSAVPIILFLQGKLNRHGEEVVPPPQSWSEPPIFIGNAEPGTLEISKTGTLERFWYLRTGFNLRTAMGHLCHF